MQMTIDLDDDINAGIRKEMLETGESFKEAVNRLLRLGFAELDVEKEVSDSRSRAQ
jgi:hypothetical protein